MADATGGGDGETTPAPDSCPHSILTIPFELFERMTELMHPEDLPNLRLVNRECAAKVLRVFKQVHFAERSFLIPSPERLSMLGRISESEVLGRAIRTLVLCFDVLPPECDSYYMSYHTDRNVARRLTHKSFEFAKETGATYRSFLHRQDDFILDRIFMHVLTTIFSRLRKVDSHPNIEVRSAMTCGPKPFFWNTLERRTGERLVVVPFYTEPLYAILRAISLSGLAPSNIGVLGSDWPWSLYAHAANPRTRSIVTDVLANVIRLDLEWSSDNQYTMTDASTMLGLLQGAPQLQILTLYVWRDIHDCNLDDMFVRALLDARFPALKQLNIGETTITFASLRAFLLINPQLEWVTISDAWILEIPAATQVKDVMLSEMELGSGFATELLRYLTNVDKAEFWDCFFCFRDDNNTILKQVGGIDGEDVKCSEPKPVWPV